MASSKPTTKAATYAAARDRGVPELVREPGAFQTRVDDYKAGLDPQLRVSPSALAAAYEALRAEREAQEAAETALSVKLRAIEQLIEDVFTAANIEGLRLTSGQMVKVEPEISVSVEDPDALNAWVKSQGLERLLKLNSQTLGSMVKERLRNAEEIPPGVALSTYKSVWLR